VEVRKRLGRLQWSCEDVEEGCGGDADQRWGELGRFDLAQGRAERHCVMEKLTRKIEGEEAVEEGALFFLVGIAFVQDP
jgi:hypothetical protein